MALTTPAPQSAIAADGSLVFRIPAMAIEHELEGTRSYPTSQLVHSNDVQSPPTSEQTSSRKKQRTGSELTPAHTSDEASSDAESPSVVAVRGRGGRTKKKNWYYVQQKEENASLRLEIERLEALKAHVVHGSGGHHRTFRSALYKQQCETELLRQAVREQRLLLARVQSGIAGNTSAAVFPLERFIRLERDWTQRAATFVQLRGSILHDAERYLAERTRYLNPTLEYSQSERFRLPNGDYCFSNFEIAPLEGFTSVKQVLDTMRAYYFNMEIEWTENSGELMIREGDFESGEEGVGTQRLVRATNCGAQIESNLVLVSRIVKDSTSANPDGSIGDAAFLACDFVNDDELFPYRPETRLRQDTTSATVVKMFPSEDPSAPPLIVLTQSYVGMIRQTKAGTIPWEVVFGVTFDPAYCFKSLVRTLHDRVRSTTTRPISH